MRTFNKIYEIKQQVVINNKIETVIIRRTVKYDKLGIVIFRLLYSPVKQLGKLNGNVLQPIIYIGNAITYTDLIDERK